MIPEEQDFPHPDGYAIGWDVAEGYETNATTNDNIDNDNDTGNTHND